MSNIRVVSQIFLYDDDTFTNQPDKVRLKYLVDLQDSLTVDYRVDRILAASSITALGLVGGLFKWVYLSTDQIISVRFDANVDDTCIVTPSLAGTLDGILIKRGSFTTISINNAGNAQARLIVMAGA